MEDVADRHRTYAIDLWGFGDSDKSKPRYQMDDYVELVNGFLSNLGISNIPIVGHALGSAVALEYTVQYPEQVDKIMTVSLPMNSDCISRRLIDFANQSVLSKVMWWRQLSYKEVQAEAEKVGEGAITQSVQSFAQLDIAGRIAHIGSSQNSMMLAVYGEKDDLIDPSPLRSLNGNWGNIRPIGLAESKHFPMLDEASKFNRLLKDFLDLEDDLSSLELKEEWQRRTR